LAEDLRTLKNEGLGIGEYAASLHADPALVRLESDKRPPNQRLVSWRSRTEQAIRSRLGDGYADFFLENPKKDDAVGATKAFEAIKAGQSSLFGLQREIDLRLGRLDEILARQSDWKVIPK
jgi:hypothetical protein